MQFDAGLRALTRIGIDPNGGTNPFDSDVVWSANALPHDTWLQMNVSATATGGTATLFLYTTQRGPPGTEQHLLGRRLAQRRRIGRDGGRAARRADATADEAANVPFVNAQGERADGSIVHIVQAGDTLDSIAFAYGVTRADLLALNNIPDPRIIQIGQEIVVKAPPTPTPSLPSKARAEATSETSDDTPATDDSRRPPCATLRPLR